VAARAPDTVHRLRLRLGAGTPRAEAPRWRHRAASLLDRTDLRPPGLPPSAVLLVRALSVPVPRRALEPGGLGAWERGVRERLAEALRRAVRAERGRVPPWAEAVLFEDPAEWLACTALSLGGAPQWWWPPALRAPPLGREAWVRHLWAEARYVPGMVARLADWRRVEEGVGTIAEGEAGRVLRAVVEAFGVRYAPPEASLPETSPAGTEALSALAAPPPGGLHERDPYPSLSPAQAELALGALAIQRAPARVRALGLPLPEGPRPRPPLPPSGLPQPPLRPPLSPPEPALRPASPLPLTRLAETPPPAAPGETSAARPPEATNPSALPAPSVRTTEASGALPEGPTLPPEVRPSARPEFSLPEGVPTRLAGVLYLLNLLISLDVSEAFAAWRRRGHLSLWGLLEAVARALLNEADGRDPLWPLLAALDGRPEGEPAGAGVAGPPGVALPRPWAEELAEGTGAWHWSARRWRLCLWSDLGVPLTHVPRDATPPSAQARALLDQRRPSASGTATPSASLRSAPPRGEGWAEPPLSPAPGTPGPPPSGGSPPEGGVGGSSSWRQPSASGAPLRRRPAAEAPLGPEVEGVAPGLRRWLAVVVPFLRWRLGQALGDAPLDEVLRSPGRVVVTSSHVDLVQPMAAVSLAARRAGLDRDPGWLPEAGRVVLFHFEAP
jgi:hypothetical protein